MNHAHLWKVPGTENSKDPDDQELAKMLVPRRKYVVGGIVYSDEKGTKVDYEGKDKGVLIPRSVYQDIIDLYLDEDEAGDMTDPRTGYDIKLSVLVQVRMILHILLVHVNLLNLTRSIQVM